MSDSVSVARDRTVIRHPPRTEHVRLSVIMPAYRATTVLPKAVAALAASDLPREDWELVIAVDGDSMGRDDDRTGELALELADTVVRLPGKPRGPAYARNRAAEAARGEILVFVDSDVCVHPDALTRILERLDTEPDVAAVFGSYDDRPEARTVVSQYRNLLHHFVHQNGGGDAETFWAGCGAIRTAVFHEVGMYDEWHFARPQIEDIELGRRLRRAGHRILLDPAIQACHLKKWSLTEVLRTDLQHRGVPWTRLILHEGPNPGGSSLNVRPVNRLSVVSTWLAFGMLPAALVFRSGWPLVVALVCVLIVVALNAPFFATVRRSAGWGVALGSIPLHLMFYFSNGLSAVSGAVVYSVVGAPLPPPDVAAFEEVGVETWPPLPSRPKESVWYEHGA
ncbi:MAG: glycosyltransferase family 2 protein [Gemmatimonadota bacterium]|nr:glycosyltransferase family 2 protein [Gemmatimonadota bacterium]